MPAPGLRHGLTRCGQDAHLIGIRTPAGGASLLQVHRQVLLLAKVLACNVISSVYMCAVKDYTSRGS